MSSTLSALAAVALVVAIVAGGFVVWGVIELVKTARSARRLADDVDVRAVPLLDKADVTVDAVNAELLRVDILLTEIEEIADRFANTAETVEGVVTTPAHVVGEIAERVRMAWRWRRGEGHGRRTGSHHAEGADKTYPEGQGPSTLPVLGERVDEVGDQQAPPIDLETDGGAPARPHSAAGEAGSDAGSDEAVPGGNGPEGDGMVEKATEAEEA